MSLLLKIVGIGVAVFLIIANVPGLSITQGWTTIALIALVWALIAQIIRPVLRLLTFPITLVTFGLFSFVLNALLFWCMTLVIPSFHVDGIVPALIGAFLLSTATWVLDQVF